MLWHHSLRCPWTLDCPWYMYCYSSDYKHAYVGPASFNQWRIQTFGYGDHIMWRIQILGYGGNLICFPVSHVYFSSLEGAKVYGQFGCGGGQWPDLTPWICHWL